DGRPAEYEWFFHRVRWSRDGTRLLGDDGPLACAVDLPGGRMRWLARIGDAYWDGLSMPVAWSPDGRLVPAVARGSAKGEPGRRIEVWSLGDEPACVRSIDTPEETTAVLWGADGVLAAIGEHTLRFVRALTGEILGDFAFDQEPDEELRPVEEGEFLHGMFQE